VRATHESWVVKLATIRPRGQRTWDEGTIAQALFVIRDEIDRRFVLRLYLQRLHAPRATVDDVEHILEDLGLAL
jgi:hypothetical protein